MNTIVRWIIAHNHKNVRCAGEEGDHRKKTQEPDHTRDVSTYIVTRSTILSILIRLNVRPVVIASCTRNAEEFLDTVFSLGGTAPFPLSRPLFTRAFIFRGLYLSRPLSFAAFIFRGLYLRGLYLRGLYPYFSILIILFFLTIDSKQPR